MPPRWPRKPDRKDPDFRKLDDRMNFAFHVAVAATSWEWLTPLTLGWVGVVLLHLIYISAIANYDQTPPKST
jgi:hypothetical protein